MDHPRIMLRPLEDADLNAIHTVVGNAAVMRFSLSGAKSRAEAEEFLQRAISNYQKQGFGLLAVVHRADALVMGYCGLATQEIDGKTELEVTYRLHPDYWGQGFGTEAASMIRDRAFTCSLARRIVAIIEPENKSSIRVAQKIGMHFEREFLFRRATPGPPLRHRNRGETPAANRQPHRRRDP
ncbi:MAG: GNAT family N-acetyltransferase [Opitutaceae bacterium]|nr:GNAT family N-acetyltransferase [Opitutaceae bacterium]